MNICFLLFRCFVLLASGFAAAIGDGGVRFFFRIERPYIYLYVSVLWHITYVKPTIFPFSCLIHTHTWKPHANASYFPIENFSKFAAQSLRHLAKKKERNGLICDFTWFTIKREKKVQPNRFVGDRIEFIDVFLEILSSFFLDDFLSKSHMQNRYAKKGSTEWKFPHSKKNWRWKKKLEKIKELLENHQKHFKHFIEKFIQNTSTNLQEMVPKNFIDHTFRDDRNARSWEKFKFRRNEIRIHTKEDTTRLTNDIRYWKNDKKRR